MVIDTGDIYIRIHMVVNFLSARYDINTDKMNVSYSKFKAKDLKLLGKLFLRVCKVFKAVDFEEGLGEDGKEMQCNNLTLINFFLLIFGPLHERTLTSYLLMFQVSLFPFIQVYQDKSILAFIFCHFRFFAP